LPAAAAVIEVPFAHGAASAIRPRGIFQPAFSVSTFKVASWGPFALRGAPTPGSEAFSQNALG
jgi:hypothetical protein